MVKREKSTKKRLPKGILCLVAILLILLVLGIGLISHEVSYHNLKVHVYRNPITELHFDEVEQISHCIGGKMANRHIYTEQEMAEFIRIYNDLELPRWGSFWERDRHSNMEYDGTAVSTAKISIEMKDGTEYFVCVWYIQKAAGTEKYKQQYYFLLERGAETSSLHPVLEERYRIHNAEALIEFHNGLDHQYGGVVH